MIILGYVENQLEAEAISKACEEIEMPFWLADTSQHDCPLIWSNKAFRKFARVPEGAKDRLTCHFGSRNGANPEYLADRCAACKSRQKKVTCTVNFGRADKPTLNVLSIQPITLSSNRELVVGCLCEFKENSKRIGIKWQAEKLSRALRMAQQSNQHFRNNTPDLEMVFLNALLLRFDCAFTRLSNALILARNLRWRRHLDEMRDSHLSLMADVKSSRKQ
ncbi:MAG: hypothetical protein AB8B47_07255 [Roseobacter sp.]